MKKWFGSKDKKESDSGVNTPPVQPPQYGAPDQSRSPAPSYKTTASSTTGGGYGGGGGGGYGQKQQEGYGGSGGGYGASRGGYGGGAGGYGGAGGANNNSDEDPNRAGLFGNRRPGQNPPSAPNN